MTRAIIATPIGLVAVTYLVGLKWGLLSGILLLVVGALCRLMTFESKSNSEKNQYAEKKEALRRYLDSMREISNPYYGVPRPRRHTPPDRPDSGQADIHNNFHR